MGKKSKVRAWGNGRLQEQVFRINVFKYELLLFKDISEVAKPKKGLK